MRSCLTYGAALIVICNITFAQGDQNKEKTATPNSVTSKSTEMKLMPIPAGTFMMGIGKEDAKALIAKDSRILKRLRDFEPQHEVAISAFYMGAYEVTQGEYTKVMGKNPSGLIQGAGKSLQKFPVTSVSWFDTIEFCNKLSQKDKLTPRYTLKDVKRQDDCIQSATVELIAGQGYRLPTEAEWEYACRGNTTTAFNVGEKLTQGDANFDGFHKSSNPRILNRPTKVGSYKKNEFGLFDMHGNVAEFCFDSYVDTPYQGRTGLTTNPVTSIESESRVVRGGGFSSNEWEASSYWRMSMMPGQPWEIGFRVVRE